MSTIPQDEAQINPSVIGRAQHLNWASIPIEHVAEGIQRQMVVGEGLMICRFRFAPFLVTPEHEHPHEQMSIVVSGRVRFSLKALSALRHPATCSTFRLVAGTAQL